MKRWVVAWMVGFTGCSSVIPMSEYCQRVAQTECEVQQRCGLWSTAFDCGRVKAAYDCLEPYGPALDAGVLQYDGVAAAACLAALREPRCEDGLGASWRRRSSEPSCRSVFHGTASEGQACGVCAVGLSCWVNSSFCGTCVPTPDAGLVALPGENEPCFRIEGDGDGCVLGMSCEEDASGTYRCVRQPGAGEACGPGPCREGAACVGGVCVTKARAGEACGAVGCERGLFCDANGTCVVLRQLGEACASTTECAWSLCVDGVCRGPQTEGEPCSDELTCASSLACVDGVCVPRAALGEPCGQRGCAGTALCVDGACRDRLLECR